MAIKEQKAQARTSEAQSKAAHIQHALHISNKSVGQRHRHAHKGNQAIQAIGQIHRVGCLSYDMP